MLPSSPSAEAFNLLILSFMISFLSLEEVELSGFIYLPYGVFSSLEYIGERCVENHDIIIIINNLA
jgi:hypothetical protein